MRKIYTYAVCKSIASICANRKEFRISHASAYAVSCRNGWTDEFFPESKRWHIPADKEVCRKIASTFASRTRLKESNLPIYRRCCKMGWINEFFPFNTINVRTLDKDTCEKVAKTFSSRTELKRNSSIVYKKCCKTGWITEFFPNKVYCTSSYTYEKCREIAATCHSLSEFKKTNSTAYEVALKNQWHLEFAKEFNYLSKGDAIRKSRGFLSIADIEKIAHNYTTLKDFRTKEPKIYQRAVARHIIASFTWLARIVDEKHPWMGDTVYAYEFLDSKVVYIGRTINMERRHKEHCQSKDTVAKFAKEHNIDMPSPIVLHTGVQVTVGKQLECEEIDHYKKEGWTLLNKAKGGSIGALVQRLSKEHCIEVAKRYKYLMDFEREHHREYNTLLKYGCIDDCTWLKRRQIKCGTWNDYKICYAEALKYKSRKDFARSCSGAYQSAVRNHWIDGWKWLATRIVADSYWTYDKCKEEALKYTSIADFATNARQACKYSRKNNWIADYVWLERSHKAPGYWTYDRCKAEATRYTSKIAFKTGNNAAYQVATAHHWLDDWEWITPQLHQNSYWTYDTCKAEAEKYSSRTKFKYGQRAAYTLSVKNGWIYEWFPKANYKTTRVAQYSADGSVLLKVFDSIANAANAVGAVRPSISAVCSGKLKTAKGFVWKYVAGLT